MGGAAVEGGWVEVAVVSSAAPVVRSQLGGGSRRVEYAAPVARSSVAPAARLSRGASYSCSPEVRFRRAALPEPSRATCTGPSRPTCLWGAPTAFPPTAAITLTTPMASPPVLAFDAEGRPVKFDTWLDDLHLFLQLTAKEDISLYDHALGHATAPAATADSTARS
ncbi:unnamed protein product [Closterium sp. NIES-54]